MVPNKEVDLYSRVSDLGQLSQQSHISFWHYFSVFIPEVKNITHNKNFGGIMLYLIKEFNNRLFPFEATFTVRSTQVKIGKEIDFFIRGKLHLAYFFC